MRHGKKFNHLGRKAAHRKALMRNLSIALIEHKRIETTLAKAKALRRYVEPLVTRCKTNTTHSRRVVFSYLQSKDTVTELFTKVAEAVGDRPGGYVRVIRTGFRKGDGAEMALIELVDFNPDYNGKEVPEMGGKKKRRRRRRGGGGGSSTVTDAGTAAKTAVAAVAAEEVIDEVSGNEEEE